MDLLIASGNPHKAKEFQDLLDGKLFTIMLPSPKISIKEDGDTFMENSRLKAEAYYHVLKKPVLADDSGLIVEELPQELGVHSARFGGEGLDDKGRMELLLKKLQGIEDKKRKASFVCVLCFYLDPKEIFFFEGHLNGRIAQKAQGEDGFGYDPIFLPENLDTTLAQNPDWKKQHSHRAKACQRASEFFSSRNS